jgi:hypothetical protein
VRFFAKKAAFRPFGQADAALSSNTHCNTCFLFPVPGCGDFGVDFVAHLPMAKAFASNPGDYAGAFEIFQLPIYTIDGYSTDF